MALLKIKLSSFYDGNSYYGNTASLCWHSPLVNECSENRIVQDIFKICICISYHFSTWKLPRCLLSTVLHQTLASRLMVSKNELQTSVNYNRLYRMHWCLGEFLLSVYSTESNLKGGKLIWMPLCLMAFDLALEAARASAAMVPTELATLK